MGGVWRGEQGILTHEAAAVAVRRRDDALHLLRLLGAWTHDDEERQHHTPLETSTGTDRGANLQRTKEKNRIGASSSRAYSCRAPSRAWSRCSTCWPRAAGSVSRLPARSRPRAPIRRLGACPSSWRRALETGGLVGIGIGIGVWVLVLVWNLERRMLPSSGSLACFMECGMWGGGRGREDTGARDAADRSTRV